MKQNPLTFFDLITYRVEVFFSAQWVGEASELFRSILFVSIFQTINLLTLLNIVLLIFSKLHVNLKVFLLLSCLFVLVYNLLRYYVVLPRDGTKEKKKEGDDKDSEGRVTIAYIIISLILLVASFLVRI